MLEAGGGVDEGIIGVEGEEEGAGIGHGADDLLDAVEGEATAGVGDGDGDCGLVGPVA